MAGDGNGYIGKFIKIVYRDDGKTKIIRGECKDIDELSVTVLTQDGKLKTIGKSVITSFGEAG